MQSTSLKRESLPAEITGRVTRLAVSNSRFVCGEKYELRGGMKPPRTWITLQRLHRIRIAWKSAEFDTTGRSFDQAPILTTSTTRLKGPRQGKFEFHCIWREESFGLFAGRTLGQMIIEWQNYPSPDKSWHPIWKTPKIVQQIKSTGPRLAFTRWGNHQCWRLTVPLKANSTRLFAYSRELGKEIGHQDPISLWFCRFYRTQAQYTFHENDYPLPVRSLS